MLALLVACASDAAPRATAAGTAATEDIRRLAVEMERLHPNLFHTVPRARFRRAVDDLVARLPELGRNQLLVELMRLALPGPRDGHTGLFPLAPEHRRALHLYPLRLWSFPEGLFVVGAPGRPELVGTRLTAIEAMPVEEAAAKVRPLVSFDNESSLLLRVPEYLVTAEVLHGLGITDGAGSARFTFQTRVGERVEAALVPVPASEYLPSLHDVWRLPAPAAAAPLWLRNPERTQWFARLDRGRVVYAAYTMTTEETFTFAAQLLRRARNPKVQRVIVDVRLNGGGNNTTYGALLNALRDRSVNRAGRLVLLTGRNTYSAAGNFVAEVDASTRARIVGEAAGGSPHNYGDPAVVDLPSLGWSVRVATSFQATSGRRDDRVAIEPDVAVPLGVADYLAGRDPVLARAIELR